MRNILAFISLILVGCNPTGQRQEKSNDVSQYDTMPAITNTNYLPKPDTRDSIVGVYDSLANAKVDTTALAGKREWIRNQFHLENSIVWPLDDTLFDLTYDREKDYVIRYYGAAGTGIKNRVKVYLFNRKCRCYVEDEQLSRMVNPSYYITQKKITGFYLANGGGGGEKLEWINDRWTVTKEFSVDNQGDSSKWEITYPLKKKKEIRIQPYQGIPAKEILETQTGW